MFNNLNFNFMKNLLNLLIYATLISFSSCNTVLNEVDNECNSIEDDFKGSIYNEYDRNNVEGSRDEFLNFLDQKKQDFQREVVSLNFLDQQEKKDILVAQMLYEVGLLELLIEYSDAISTLGQNLNSENNFKSISSCNWWCMTKLYVKCQLLSCGAILSFSATATPASFLAWAAGTGLSYLAIDCWIEYYTNLWGVIGL